MAYLIVGDKMHGAEKRVMQLALDREHAIPEGIDGLLVINEALFKAGQQDRIIGPILSKFSKYVRVLLDRPRWPGKVRKAAQIAELYWMVRREEIEITHAYLGGLSLIVPLVRLGKKVVFELTSPDVVGGYLSYAKTKKFFHDKLYRLNAVSPSVCTKARLALTDDGLSDHQLVCTGLPYVSVKQVISQKEFEQKEKLVVCASRFIPRKNVNKFAEAVAEICRAGTDWKFEIWGSGPQQELIEGQLSNEIAAGYVTVGYTRSLIERLRKSSILVSLITPDNYPSQSIFEAMAMGNYLLLSDTGDSRKFIGDYNGRLTPLDRVTAELKELLNTTNEAIHNGGWNSVQLVTDRFSRGNYWAALSQSVYA